MLSRMFKWSDAPVENETVLNEYVIKLYEIYLLLLFLFYLTYHSLHCFICLASRFSFERSFS